MVARGRMTCVQSPRFLVFSFVKERRLSSNASNNSQNLRIIYRIFVSLQKNFELCLYTKTTIGPILLGMRRW